MAGYVWKGVLFTCLVICYISPLQSAKLNVPRVLLPLFDQFSTNFTLEVSENGCYRWSSSRPDIVQVIPLNDDEGCSIKAVVSAVTKEPIRNTVIVLAEEVKTGFILRCDVIVDVIKSLAVVTTTRELYMEEAPEMFEVRADDNQGNEFTTLEGVEFEWNIENIAQTPTANQVLRFITFMDSPYETPATVAKFDTLGVRGHIVLIEGVKTGAAKVSVRLPHTEYSEVPKIEVVLTVVANLLLDPQDTHILAGDTVKFRLLQMQHGRLEEVPLPSAQYMLDVEEQDVLAIDRSVSMVRGLRLGLSRVVLRDRHSLDSESGLVRLPTATVTVTEPAYLRLSLLPYNSWAVLVDEPCSIQVQLFDRNSHKIHIGDAVSVRTLVSESYFQVYSMTRNGTVIDGKTISVGTAPVTATLESVRAVGGKEVKLKPVISAQEDMLIYPRLSVTPCHVIVPWDPGMTRSEVELKASGGDGSYSWASNNVAVGTVSQSGIVRCKGLGESSIVVSMPRNPAIRATAKVELLPPAHIEILKHILEAPVKKPIVLHIVLYADKEDENGILKRVHFTHCREIQFKVEITNKNFFQNITDRTKPFGKACATVAVYGEEVGSSVVKVSYNIQNVLLEASTEVAAFSPLEVVHPEKKMTVLALGTSRHIVWKGGPRVWFGRPAEHTRVVSADSEAVSVEEVTSNSPSELYVYSVLCRGLGEFNVVLTVKNIAPDTKFKHTESVSSVKVICSKPRFITFSLDPPVNKSCPYSADPSHIVALSNKPIKVLVTITDSLGRVFHNATSFHIDWAMSTKSLGYAQFDGAVVLDEKKEFNYLIPLHHYQIVHPKNRTGTLVIEAAVVDYRLQMLNILRINPEHPAFWIENEQGIIMKPVIKNSLTVVLVNVSVVTPDRATVFNHPKNKVTLRVTQGSGFYKLYQSSVDVAEVQYYDSTKSVEIIPKTDGLLKLTLVDLCLLYSAPIVEVQVLKVGSMLVEMVDRVQQGSTITATVWLFDSGENALEVPNSELLEMRPVIESSLATITKVQTDSADNQVKFNITGIKLGSTTVTFVSGYGEREMRSHPQPLQVFPPLRLIPQDVTLAVGAVFQVTPTGGPQPDCIMEYISSDINIAKVNSAGVVETQKVGDMSVSGMAVGKSKASGSKIVYSKDMTNVHVIPLEGVKIHSPLVKLKAGCKMPLWATGVPEKLSPMVLGSIQPPLAFKWSTSTADIVELQDVLHSTGVEVPEKDRLSMRVVALKPGRVTISLNVTWRAAKYGSSVEFSDHLDIEIVEELRVIKPRHHKASTLLMAPFAQMLLRTNKDSVGDVTYSVSGSSETAWSAGEATALSKQTPVVVVSRTGLVTSHSALGSASVLIHSTEDNGLEQTLPVNVEVKPVKYIMLNVNTNLRLGGNKRISALPRGLDVGFIISYHDNTGEGFAASRTDIKIMQNRFDTVKVARGEVNGTLVAKLTSYGSTVLKIWDETMPIVSEDYVKLRVDHLITPSKSEMTVGDVACFSMPLLDAQGQSGVWTSASPDVLLMETSRGVGRAIRPGQAVITYDLSNTITTSTQLQVFPIQMIVFLPLNGRNLTNWRRFSVPLLLLSERDSADKTCNLLAQDGHCGHSFTFSTQHCPFTCEIRFNSPMTPVDIHHVFHVQPSFSFDTGVYSCDFEALTSPCSNTSVLTSNVTLRVISDSLVSEPLVIPFLPAVFLPLKELVLSDMETRTFPVIGIPQVLAQVQVFASDVSILSITARPSETNTIVYQVTVNSLASTSLADQQPFLYVFSPLTGQNITVPVYFNMKGTRVSAPCMAQPPTDWYQNSETFWSVAYTVISVLVLFLVMRYSEVFKWARNNPTPSVYATGTPNPAGHIYHNGTSSQLSTGTRSFLYQPPFSDISPVYGDPNLTPSPEPNRRHRR